MVMSHMDRVYNISQKACPLPQQESKPVNTKSKHWVKDLLILIILSQWYISQVLAWVY